MADTPRRSSRQRVLDALQGQPVPLSANELAPRVGLSQGTVLKYLKQLHLDGVIAERIEQTPGLRGQTSYWFVPQKPLPPLEPTDLVLCDSCARRDYQSVFRYQRACSEVADDRWEAIGDTYQETSERGACDSCGGPLFPAY